MKKLTKRVKKKIPYYRVESAPQAVTPKGFTTEEWINMTSKERRKIKVRLRYKNDEKYKEQKKEESRRNRQKSKVLCLHNSCMNLKQKQSKMCKECADKEMKKIFRKRMRDVRRRRKYK